ncbi:MAG: hypothetical protein WCH11_04405 [Bdellovibrio sp.]
MNRRFFFGLAAQISGALAVGFFGKQALGESSRLPRTRSSNFESAYGYYGVYGSYGIYGLYGYYGGYGSYGQFGYYGGYGSYGQFGTYGPYGQYGMYGYGPYYGYPRDRYQNSVPQPPKAKKRGQANIIDFESLTNRKS